MTGTKCKYIAVGNRGTQAIVLTTDHPRKELLENRGATRADKVYVDDENGNPQHIGYIIGGEWFTLYAVEGRGPR